MDICPAESVPLAPSRCTISYTNLNSQEYIAFQGLLSDRAVSKMGGLTAIVPNYLLPEATAQWRIEFDMLPIIIIVAYQKLVGGTMPQDIINSLASAIGAPQVVEVGHVFALCRLLVHYKQLRTSVPLCTEYIQIPSHPDGETIRIQDGDLMPTSLSDPVIAPDTERPGKRRRVSDIGSVRVHNIIPTEAQLKHFHEACRVVTADAAQYARPELWHTLPFPFIYSILPHDRFSFKAVLDENDSYSYNTFEWMGREVFPRLVEAVSDLRTDNSHASSAFLLGPIGAGKSHLLAALALHLRSQGKVVVYIPHCGDLFWSPVKYTAAALLCAFAGSSAEDRRRRHEIRMLDSTQAIEKWCSQQSTQGIRFYFLIDQLNELEPIATSMESRGTRLKHFLLNLYRESICVRSSSTNDQHGHSLLGRGKREDLFDFHQTLSKAECASWSAHHVDRLPQFEEEELEWWHDYVGRIFLYYPSLLNHAKPTFAQAWPQIRASPVLKTSRANINLFAAAMLYSPLKDSYIAAVKAFITGTSATAIRRDLIDHRYCIVDDTGRGRVACGFARRELTAFLERQDHSIALSTEWLVIGLSHAITCPPALGFLIKRSIIASLLTGVAASGLAIQWQAVPKYTLPSGDSLPRDIPSDLLRSGKKSLLIVPEEFNVSDIDCLFIQVDHVAKNVLVIPVQITLADRHKDSAAAFYTNWDKWRQRYPGYNLHTAFLWVVENFKPGTTTQTPAVRQSTRSGEKVGPEYIEHFVHLDTIASRVWQSIVDARLNLKMVEDA